MKSRYATDDAVVDELRRRLREEGKTLKQLADELGVSYPFLSGYTRRAWPHAQARLLEALGFEPTRYYRRKR